MKKQVGITRGGKKRRPVGMPREQALLLVVEAAAARINAYAPYSKFRVGAALLGADGRVFRGCNVENASFGLTVCAERVALCSAVAAGCRRFKAIAIVADGDRVPRPCGACLQSLAEFRGGGLTLLLGIENKPEAFISRSLAQLLPERFTFRQP